MNYILYGYTTALLEVYVQLSKSTEVYVLVWV